MTNYSIDISLNGTIESFSEWLKEINSIDDKALRKRYNAMSDTEITNAILNDEINESDIFPYLSLTIARSIADILEQE